MILSNDGFQAQAIKLDLTQPPSRRTLWMGDLPQRLDKLTAPGVRFAPGASRKGDAGIGMAFLHPKVSDELPMMGEGVPIKLVQAPNAFARRAAQPA